MAVKERYLKPAICYKSEIDNALSEYFYTKDMMYYMGCNANYLLEVKPNSEDGGYQWAVVDSKGKLIGYIAYFVNYYSSNVDGFGAFSFDRGNPLMGKALFALMEDLLKKFRRVEFRAVGGNPAIRGYDSFLERHSDIGRKLELRDYFRDVEGNYHSVYIYEFIRK